LGLDSSPKGSNEIVNDQLEERQLTIKVLREQLLRAQSRMKKIAERKMSERSFQVGDWVHLKLQSYCQITVHGQIGTHKLKPKFYGSFEILKKVSSVAYKLNLPNGSLIHPVFHISQLKPCRGKMVNPMVHLPVMIPGGKLRIEPIDVLDRRVVKKKNETITEILVKWSNLDDEEATWEYYTFIYNQFSDFKLEDKLHLKGGVLSQNKRNRLIAIERAKFKFKLDGSTEDGHGGLTGCPRDDPIADEVLKPMKLALVVESAQEVPQKI
jgi:Chromo (CHRromatin Organisation MOdifier) domain